MRLTCASLWPDLTSKERRERQCRHNKSTEGACVHDRMDDVHAKGSLVVVPHTARVRTTNGKECHSALATHDVV